MHKFYNYGKGLTDSNISGMRIRIVNVCEQRQLVINSNYSTFAIDCKTCPRNPGQPTESAKNSTVYMAHNNKNRIL